MPKQPRPFKARGPRPDEVKERIALTVLRRSEAINNAMEYMERALAQPTLEKCHFVIRDYQSRIAK